MYKINPPPCPHVLTIDSRYSRNFVLPVVMKAKAVDDGNSKTDPFSLWSIKIAF